MLLRPITATCSGTRIPMEYSALSAAIAIRSLAAQIAVGGAGCAISFLTRSMQRISSHWQSSTHSGRTGRLAMCMAAANPR